MPQSRVGLMCTSTSLRLDKALRSTERLLKNDHLHPFVENEIPQLCLCSQGISADLLVPVSRVLVSARDFLYTNGPIISGLASVLTGTILMWTLPSNMRT